MIVDRHPGKLIIKGTHGFTLIEVMIVLVIAGILALGVVFMFANPSAKSKNQAFTLLGELNMARSEAVNRNQDVLVDFITDVVDGYQICIDTIPNNDCSDETGDNLIQETYFPEDVQYYDPTVIPDGGPEYTPGGGGLIGKTGIIKDNGVGVTEFSLEPDGTLEDGIGDNVNVVIYVPTKNNHNDIYGTPYAVTISNGSGRVRISRWTKAGVWNTK